MKNDTGMKYFWGPRDILITVVTVMLAVSVFRPVFGQHDPERLVRQGNLGKEFILAFLPNLDAVGVVELHLTSEMNTEITVEYPVNNPSFITTVPVSPGAVTMVELPVEASTAWSIDQVGNNCVRASAAVDFGCYLINRRTFSSDAALGLPVSLMNTEYIVMTYNGAFGGGEFVVNAAFDDTRITVIPQNDMIGHPAGVPFTVTLDRGEGFFGRSVANSGPQASLAGTIVTSNLPVGVVNGNVCTQVPFGTDACDHVFEVAQPVQTWGQEVLVENLPNRTEGVIYRILASEDGTEVTLDGAPLGSINRGEFLETGTLAGNHVFSANDRAIFVDQFMTGVTAPGATLGDPAMGNMIHTEQFLTHYTFSTVGGNQFVENFLTVIAADSDVGSLTLDGMSIDPGEFSPIAGTDFSSAVLPISSGTHSTASTNPHGITVAGYNTADSYLYPGGARFDVINIDTNPPVCEISASDRFSAMCRATENQPRDTGIFAVELASENNVELLVDPFTEGDTEVAFTVKLLEPNQPGSGIVVVTDGLANACSLEVSLPGNRKPACAAIPPGPFTIIETQPLSFEVTAKDPDGDDVELSVLNLPPGATMTPELPLGGSGATGLVSRFDWTPSAGQAGAFEVVYTVADGLIADTCRVNITVEANAGPELAVVPVSSLVISEGDSAVFTVIGTDQNTADTLTIKLFPGDVLPPGAVQSPELPVRGPSGVSSTFRWKPELGQAGIFLVKYQAFDLLNNTDFASADIVVQKRKIAPLCRIEPQHEFTVTEGAMVSFTITATDSNPSDSVTISTTGLPEGASMSPELPLSGPASGVTSTFNWQTTLGQAGTHTVDFLITDSDSLTTSCSVVINVEVDRRPVCSIVPSDNFQVIEGQPVSFMVSGKDSGDVVTLDLGSGSSLPPGAVMSPALPLSAEDAVTSTFNWTETAGHSGDFNIEYTVTDGAGQISSCEVSITVISDTTAPSCELTGVDAGPPFSIQVTVQDLESGLKEVMIVAADNATVDVPKFSPGTTDPLMITATKIDQKISATVVLEVFDGAGNSTLCDPVYTTLSSVIPEFFELKQNYPNPFNPSTTIDFDLAAIKEGEVKVSLKIYDVNGRELKTLIEEPMQPGQYSVTWDATNHRGEKVAGGVYFYRLIAGDYVATRKMILMK